ncbi:MAG: hypothetical protein DRH56_02980 [Deltaproteobacteria bacterium]|nr:MAG: hypothetical protein DRH56_02980 [Deltaproteobacteria bacterium]
MASAGGHPSGSAMEANRLLWPLLVFLALLVSVSFQGSRGLYETSEGRYAECAREMVESGNYLEPTLGYRPHWTKPPMTYWAIAAGIRLAGPGEWGVRLFNSAAFFLTVLAVVRIGTVLWDARTGLIAGLIYASSPFPVFGAYAVTTDTLLTLFEVSAVLCYLTAFYAAAPRKQRVFTTAMWGFLGLGFLTKGPPALLVLLPVLLWHFLHRDRPRIIGLAQIAAFAGIGLSWYLVVCFRHPGLMSYFIGHEVVDRLVSHAVHNPEWYKPFSLYLPVLILGAGPWCCLGVRAFWRKRLLRPGRIRASFRRGGPGALMLLWLLLPLAVFFIVESRLHLYVLPLYAPVSLAIARAISGGGEGETRLFLKRTVLVAVITGFVLVGLKGVAAVLPARKDMRPLYAMCRDAGGMEARFVAFDRPKLYGLQYYLNGRLERVSRRGRAPWADAAVEEMIGRIKKGEIRRSVVFICSGRQEPKLVTLLRRSGIDSRRVESRYWILRVVPGK